LIKIKIIIFSNIERNRKNIQDYYFYLFKIPMQKALANTGGFNVLTILYKVVLLSPFYFNMRKLSLSAIIGLLLLMGFAGTANATEQYYKDSIGFDYVYTEAYDLQNTNGNERLYLKNLADIERASEPTIHYDNQVKAHYMCDWQYNKVLDRWVCEKDYMKAYEYTHPAPTQACSFGYKLNYGKTGCVKIAVPANAHYNSYGNGWECNPGFHTSYTGTSCLSDKYVYTSCSGAGSATSNSACKNPCNLKHDISQNPNPPTAKTLSQKLFPYQTSQIYYPQAITVTPITYTGHPVKYVDINAYADDGVEIPTVLAKTGPGTLWLLIFGLLGFIILGASRIFID
jgi:hypothetical protein